jgi:hypothetical protein
MAAPYTRIVLRPSCQHCAERRSLVTIATVAGTTIAPFREILHRHSVERLSKTALIGYVETGVACGSAEATHPSPDEGAHRDGRALDRRVTVQSDGWVTSEEKSWRVRIHAPDSYLKSPS